MKDKKHEISQRVAYIILLVFFFLLPFHAFLVTALNRGLGMDSIWITLWREGVLAILTVLAVITIILRASKGEIEPWSRQFTKVRLLDGLIVSYFLLGIVYFFYKRESVEQWMLGARYDFEFLYFYLLVRVFSFTRKEVTVFFKSALSAAVFVVIFGWALYFLPQDFLTKFGYAPYEDEWNQKTAVFACHYVEFDQSFCRMQSTFGGPGRYGLYLLFVIIASAVIARSDVTLSLSKGDERRLPACRQGSNLIARAQKQSEPVSAFLGRRLNLKNFINVILRYFHCHPPEPHCHPEPKAKYLTSQYKSSTLHAEILQSSHELLPQDDNNLGRKSLLYKFFSLLFFLLSLGALYLTLSRSAWIGLFGALGMCMVFIIKKLQAWKRILWQGAIIAVFAALIFGALAPTSIQTIFIRADSSSAHFSALVKGVKTVMKNPMGIGLGKAGPASVPFEKFLTENAYLQVAVEMGWLGGALFLSILAVILRGVTSGRGDPSQEGDRPKNLPCVILSEPQSGSAKDLSTSKHPILLIQQLRLISLLTLISLMLSGLFVHSFEEMSLNLTLFGFIGFLLDKNEK